MLKAKFDINDLTRGSTDIARRVPAQQLFSWLARSITIPAGWVALATRAGLDPLLLATGQRCDAEDLLDVLFVRVDRFEPTAEKEIPESSDGFPCIGKITVPVRALTDRDELAALRRTLLGKSDSLAQPAIESYLQPHLHGVLSDLSSRHTAAELIAGLDASEIHDAVQRRLGPACLTAGLAIDSAAAVHFDSPAWQQHWRQQVQLEQRRRHTEARTQMQEAVSAAQRHHVDHLLSIVKNLKEASGPGDRLRLPELLTGFSEAERGQLYSALWHLPTAAATRFIAAVSGQEVLLFEPPTLSKPTRRIKLPDALGALRSISTGNSDAHDPGSPSRMLAGAHRGIYVLDNETGEVVLTLRAPDATRPVQGGFNAAVLTDTHAFATHSELGVITWKLKDNDNVPGRSLLPEVTGAATTIRSVRVSDGHLWFTADASLWALPIGSFENTPGTCYRCGPAVLTAICFDGGIAYVGDGSGRVLAFDVGDPDSMRTVRSATGQPIESLHIIDTSGVSQLVIADRSNGLTVMVLGDQYTRRYEAGGSIVRRAAAAPDLFVAMNDARDRLLAWDPRRADTPLAAIVIPHLTGTTLQDVALIPA